MSNLTILGDTSGSVVLQAPAVSGSTTITMAAQSGTLNVAGPAFSAYLSTNQSIGGGNTKIAFDTEVFDTNSNFNTSNYRFTPTVAGYYQFNTAVVSPGNLPLGCAQVWKNGGSPASCQIQGYQNGASTNAYTCATAGMFYMNGTTDYVEVYLYVGSSATVSSNSNTTTFTGCLLRAA